MHTAESPKLIKDTLNWGPAILSFICRLYSLWRLDYLEGPVSDVLLLINIYLSAHLIVILKFIDRIHDVIFYHNQYRISTMMAGNSENNCGIYCFA